MILLKRLYDPYSSSEELIRCLILTAVLCPALAAVFVALRFYTARAILRGVHRDDWFILSALVFSMGFSSVEILPKQYGLGKYRDEIPRENLRYIMKMYMLTTAFPGNILGNFSILFTKASILTFYLRFSISRRLNIVIRAVLFVVITYCLLGAFLVLYACQPIRWYWDRSGPPKGKCIDVDPWYGTLSVINVVADAILLILPFWLLRPLRVGRAHKAALVGIVGTGGFVLGVSIFRLVLTFEYFDENDFFHRYGISYLWLIIETNVAIICACLPCLRALAARFFPVLMFSSKKQVPLGLETISVTHLTRESIHQQQGRDGNGVGSHGDEECGEEYKPHDTNDTMWIESRPVSVHCEEANVGFVWVPLSPPPLPPPPPPIVWRPDGRHDGWI
ncbi:hypothetical protein B0T18DRAFT_325636 [Schizothecium vesticola]|uniref:Rhodopsin domain-containing protein n=1 Tax=Schizothecium vesticola TaxID=314040 RepID=A0AA40EU07_9PEZI|nr:hypothetical protein B0T18DRAFT_325636 [Schizothecium vesticola]